MALVVNTNIASLNAQRNLGRTESALNLAIQRLSTGLRVNSAKDDAAALYTIQRMSADISGLNQAVRNAADGISLGQTAEGAMAQIHANLQRIREIAVQAANATVENRSGLQKEVDQLTQEISRIIQTTEFNGTALLSASSTLNFQVGQKGVSSHQVAVSTVVLTGLNAYSGSLTATGVIDVSTQAAASAAIASIDNDINTVSTNRATFGAVQNRFEAVIANLQNYAENLTASRSRIMDADFAQETANLTRAQILQQAGVAVLAQANALPQAALALLR
jgi:flagellin